MGSVAATCGAGGGPAEKPDTTTRLAPPALASAGARRLSHWRGLVEAGAAKFVAGRRRAGAVREVQGDGRGRPAGGVRAGQLRRGSAAVERSHVRRKQVWLQRTPRVQPTLAILTGCEKSFDRCPGAPGAQGPQSV